MASRLATSHGVSNNTRRGAAGRGQPLSYLHLPEARMEKSFGDRELEIMSVLWDHGPSTVAQMRRRLSTTLAYTTVLTILRNLRTKRAVGRRQRARAHVYYALTSRAAVRRLMVARLATQLFSGRVTVLADWLTQGSDT